MSILSTHIPRKIEKVTVIDHQELIVDVRTRLGRLSIALVLQSMIQRLFSNVIRIATRLMMRRSCHPFISFIVQRNAQIISSTWEILVDDSKLLNRNLSLGSVTKKKRNGVPRKDNLWLSKIISSDSAMTKSSRRQSTWHSQQPGKIFCSPRTSNHGALTDLVVRQK